MPGEPLVCVWEAAKVVAANNRSPTVTVTLLKDITSRFYNLPSVDYSDAKFDATLRCIEGVQFNDYKTYVHAVLRKADAPLLCLIQDIENKCWEICKGQYVSSQASDDVIKMAWQIFNRYADENTFPAVIPKERTLLFLNNLSEKLGIKTKKSKIALEKGVTFEALLKILDQIVFSETDPNKVLEGITCIHGKLTRQIIRCGWMSKRSKNISNWSGWLKRWFVLTPGKLTYYAKGSCADPDGQSMKGEINLVPEPEMTLEPLPPYNGAFRKYAGRFKVAFQNVQREMEMSVENEVGRKFWLEAIREALATDVGRHKPLHVCNSLHDTEPVMPKKDIAIIPQKEVTVKSEQIPFIRITEPKTEVEISKAENVVNLEEEKLKVIFLKIDKDGNGFVDEKELMEFFKQIGLSLTELDTKQIFQRIDRDSSKTISFEEFAKFFEEVMFKEDCGNSVENQLRSAFFSADRDGSGTINFKEFVEYVWEKKRSVRMSKLLKTFENLEKNGDGEVPYSQFRNHFEQEIEELGIIPEEDENEENSGNENIDNMLKSLYDETDTEELATFIRDRWKAFASFKRPGASGDIVMRGSHGMVGDFTPGNYSLMDLACFSDIPPIEPKHTVIKGVKWVTSTEAGKSGKCIFPSYFNGKIICDIATNETLRYYDCSFANGNQVKVSLLYRHGIQDFTYENKYLDDYVKNQNGGCGIERHEFTHLDCPMEDDSGNFILGKFHTTDELHLTAFRIPARHTLYIPGGVIHSNDYLKGKWRTMLSDETFIDHVHLVQPKTKTTFKPFTFTFE